MPHIHFPDKSVSYQTFVRDIAAQVVRMLKDDSDDPEYISQRRAHQIFGRRNVERWQRLGLIEAVRRPNRVDFSTAQLRLLQRTAQDYLRQ